MKEFEKFKYLRNERRGEEEKGVGLRVEGGRGDEGP